MEGFALPAGHMPLLLTGGSLLFSVLPLHDVAPAVLLRCVSTSCLFGHVLYADAAPAGTNFRRYYAGPRGLLLALRR